MATVNPAIPLMLQYGMKRSGNHAISEWLLSGMPRDYANNLVPIGPLLKQNAPYPPPQNFDNWCAQHGKRPPIYASLEDIELSYAPFHNLADFCQPLLILRHPDNMFASRIKKAFKRKMDAYPRENNRILQRAIGIWKEHARCFLGQGEALRNRIAIYFDLWLTDDRYRAKICAALSLPKTLPRPAEVSPVGRGSSFDYAADAPQQMALTDRAALLTPPESDLLRSIFEDRTLCDLRKQLETADPHQLITL